MCSNVPCVENQIVWHVVPSTQALAVGNFKRNANSMLLVVKRRLKRNSILRYSCFVYISAVVHNSCHLTGNDSKR